MEFEDEIVLANLQPVMQIMTLALKEYDQILALAASEFCASMIQVWFMASFSDANDPEIASKVT